MLNGLLYLKGMKNIISFALLAVLAFVIISHKSDIEMVLVKHNIIQNEAAVARMKMRFRENKNVPKQSLFNFQGSIKSSNTQNINSSSNTLQNTGTNYTTNMDIGNSSSSNTNISNTTLATTPNTLITTPQSQNSSYMWGVFNGWQPANIAAFESLVDKPVKIAGVFVHWGNENQFPFSFANPLKNAGKTTLIYWEAKDYNLPTDSQSNFNYDSILAGNWDSYFTQFAADAKSFGGQVILVPFEEANGDWEPWSGVNNGNTPAKHVLAYRYIHNFFQNAPNVKFGWTMNNDSVPDTIGNEYEDYYPGDVYVDYIGIDGFNFGSPWQTWDEVFGSAITKLSVHNKPIILTSMSSAQGSVKADWVRTGLGINIKNYPSVVGWIWFNENKEKDWRVNSDANTLSAFKEVINSY